MKYYLLCGNEIVQEIEVSDKDIGTIALPLLETGKQMSLINQDHMKALMQTMKFSTPEEVFPAMGLTDKRLSENIKPISEELLP